ncbi:MAG: sensor histidine kinase [Lachnospiraceae bacterium]
MLAMIISLIISFSILKPTKALIQAMKQYEENQDVAVIDNGHDELTFMADTFNQMSKRLKKQMEDIREGERQKRTLEIQALQAQINPHFIANTLNLIANIASVNNETGIEQLSNSLVDLMRDCIRNDERFVQVQDRNFNAAKLYQYSGLQNAWKVYGSNADRERNQRESDATPDFTANRGKCTFAWNFTRRQGGD